MIDAIVTGNRALALWPALLGVIGIAAGLWRGYFKARKIQPNGFKWKVFRLEIIVAIVTVSVSAITLGKLNTFLVAHHFIRFIPGPVDWWRVGLEYTASFFLFDAWFYWFHRLMHKEPLYRWVHKLHHKSTSPNMLTTLSETPMESFVNGGFVPVFLTVFTVHDITASLIIPTNLVMGLYVHSGYELFPRWWNKSWATKWFITATFHDQHHRYFIGNFGGYTTIWDRLCGTMRPRFESDFDRIKSRSSSRTDTTGAALD